MPKRKASASPRAEREKSRIKKQKQRLSQSEEAWSEAKEKDRKAHELRRKQLEAEKKQEINERDKVAHELRRKQLEAEKKKEIAEKNKEAHALRRKQVEAEKKKEIAEKNKEAHALRRKQLEAEKKKEINEKDRKAHEIQRKQLEPEKKKTMAEKDRKAHEIQRKQLEPEKKKTMAEKDRKAHEIQRKQLEPEKKKTMAEKDKIAHVKRRKQKTYKDQLKEYEKEIRYTPTTICSCCGGLWFPRGAPKVTRESLLSSWQEICKTKAGAIVPDEEEYEDQFEEEENVSIMSSDFLDRVLCVNQDEHHLCKTCSRSIVQKKPKVPKLCLSNGFEFPEIPKALEDLSPLEERLVALRIPFMQIRAIGTERQSQLKGNVVNVENDLDKCTKKIPLDLGESDTIHLKLMRRMTDHTPYMYEVIRPYKVMKAAKCLKKTELYKGITLSKSEIWRNCNKDDQLPYVCNQDDEKELDHNIEPAVEEIELGDGADESLIYNTQDLDVEGIMVAPGEGKNPIPLWKDLQAEEMSFPTIYCGKPREFKEGVKISYTDIAKSEIRRYDRRACTPTHLLYAFRKSFNEKLRNQIQIFLRKSSGGKKIRAKDARNPDFLKNLIQKDEGYAIFKEMRSTVAYFQARHKEARAMLRQEGKFTFFITLSAAETKWPETLKTLMKVVKNKDITYSEAMNLSYEEKAELIRTDPVTCMRLFDHRFRAVLNKLLKSDAGIFHPFKLKDFFTRMEFQMRGSPHIHGMFWLDGAPTYNECEPQSEAKCIEFIDKFITCAKNEEGEMESLIGFQLHKHTHTCYKKNRKIPKCRFGFPKPPMKYTSILQPLAESTQQSELERFKGLWKVIQDDLNAKGRHPPTNPSFEEYLEELEISEEDYILAIRSSIIRTTVFLKREINAIFINPYNQKLLEAWRANIDFQFALDTYACARYCVGYVFKAEGGMSKLLRAATQNARLGNLTIREKLSQYARIFIGASEVSTQEATAYLLGLEYTHCSRQFVFVNTSLPGQRTRILLPQSALEHMADEDDEIYAKGIIEHYQNRPDELKDFCLAKFATEFDHINSKPRDMQKLDSRGFKLYYELNSGGFMKRRPVRKVLRFRNYGKREDPDNYWRERLMLFMPWENEDTDLLTINARSKARELKSVLEQNSNIFFADKKIDEELLNDYMTYHGDDDEEEEDELDKEELDFMEESLFGGFVQLERPPRIEKETEPEKFLPPKPMDDDMYRQIMRSLNKKQRRFVLNLLYNVKVEESPFYHFLHGGAGVGKSHVITAIVQSLIRYYGKLPTTNPEEICVLVTAFTGKAAFNVFGMTMHTAFRLPPSQSPDAVEKLDESKANTMRSQLEKVTLYIIDEISFVKPEHLYDINSRLQQIHGNKKDFGGRSFLVVGHLRQLPPIAGRMVFLTPRNEVFAELTENHLWKKFTIYELDEIMRQRGAKQFCEALNNMSETQMRPQDVRLIKSREIGRCDPPPDSAIWLFKYVKQCEDHNLRIHQNLGTLFAISTAIDKVQGQADEDRKTRLLNMAKNWNQQQASGLPYEVRLQIGGIYFISTNIDVSDGLFNGSTGLLMDIDFSSHDQNVEQQRPIRAWLLIDDEFIGARRRKEDLTKAKDLFKCSTSEADRSELSGIIRKLEMHWTLLTCSRGG